MIEVDGLHKYFGPLHVLQWHRPVGGGRRGRLHHRPLGQRQVDAAALPQPSRSGPSSGRIRIDGKTAYRDEDGGVFRPHSNRAVAAVRAQIGMVFQQFNLFPHLTALQNIMEAPVHVLRGRKREPQRAARAGTAGAGRACRQGRRLSPRSCPAASSSAPPSPGRWRWTRRRCCSTRRPARWTRSWSPRCWR